MAATYATTGDDRHLAYENAIALADMLNDALTAYAVAEVRGNTPPLDEVGFVIQSVSDVVLGETGRRGGSGLLGFTYRQVMSMSGLLGDLLPLLAAEAHQATQEHTPEGG